MEKSSKQGINRILATPHRKDVLENQASQSLIDQVELLNQYSIQSELNIEVYVGMENHLDTTLCELAMKGIAFTINYGSYILVEPPYTDNFDDVPIFVIIPAFILSELKIVLFMILFGLISFIISREVIFNNI